MNTFLWTQALHDTVSDHTRARVTPDEVSLRCNELAKQITVSFNPDLVVAIDTGGSIPGELLGEILHKPVTHMVIRLNISVGRMYNNDPIPLCWFMSLYHHYLFHTTPPTISKGIDIDVADKRILIVDDVFHTGATADIAIEYLAQHNASEVRTVSLSYVSKRKPDFSILPSGNYCFPWSKDYLRK